MDYPKFYAEVAEWINQANQAAVKYGMEHPDFWNWVAESAGSMSKKYQDNRLVIKQMIMLIEWLEDAVKESGERR